MNTFRSKFLRKLLLLMTTLILSSHADNLRSKDSSSGCDSSDSSISAVVLGFPVTFSSKYNGQHDVYFLDSQGGGLGDPTPGSWSAGLLDTSQWIQVSSLEPKIWTGVTTQGRYDMEQWVKQYTVQYTLDGKNWQYVDDARVFEANSDRNTKINRCFWNPVYARTIRICPQSWNGHISLRFDAYFNMI